MCIYIYCKKGTGHLIEPPYQPFCYASFHFITSCNIAWGGTAEYHTLAQEDSWKEIIGFFRSVFPPTEKKSIHSKL